MCLLCIQAHSYSRIFEVLPEEIENAELMVEDAMSIALVDIFDETSVDDVAIHFSPATRPGPRDCFIQIRAHCSISLAYAKKQVEGDVKESMSSILKELFGPVTIDNVMIEPTLIETII